MVPRRGSGTSEIFKEALGKVNQVQGGTLLEGPGSAKVRQGFNFEVNPGLVLTCSFFALNDFWKVPRGSPERGAEQQQFQRGAQGGAPISLWGPEGGPKTKRDPWPQPKETKGHRVGPERRSEAPGEEQRSKINK